MATSIPMVRITTVSAGVPGNNRSKITQILSGRLPFHLPRLRSHTKLKGIFPNQRTRTNLFCFNPDCGGGFGGKRRPKTFVLRWQALSVSATRVSLAILKTPDNVRFGRAIFSADSNETLYATGIHAGWPHARHQGLLQPP